MICHDNRIGYGDDVVDEIQFRKFTLLQQNPTSLAALQIWE
jgi:hypothetical protein